MLEFILNNKTIKTDLAPGMVMLDFIRYEQHLKGTKIGCREGDCGACTVLVGELKAGKMAYRSMTSCLMPIGNAQGKHIVSVEGINNKELSPVQQAIVDEGGTQCGFCTVGFVMSLTGFCIQNKEANFENAIASIDGNICRCTGYKSLERAAQLIVNQVKTKDAKNELSWLIEQQFIPAYFEEIPKRLAEINSKTRLQNTKQNVGGGTDLYVQKHDTMVHTESNFLFDLTEYKGIEQIGKEIKLGASTTVEDLRSNAIFLKLFPRLKQHLKLVSSTPIRNMATLAGNFVNASPIGDMSIFFLALKARIVLSDGEKQRSLLLKDFYKGYKSIDKSSDEIIESIYFEIPGEHHYFNFEKVSKRTHLDIASVNSAISIELKGKIILNAKVACGGVFAFPRYLEKTSEFLTAKELTASNILQAAEILQSEIAPISDARGTAEYKRLLAQQLFFAHFIELFPHLIHAEALLNLETN